MITLSIILNAWFIPVPFFSMLFIKRYHPFEPNTGIGLAIVWPVILIIQLWFLLKRMKKRKPERETPEN
jgi:hypothetical protein